MTTRISQRQTFGAAADDTRQPQQQGVRDKGATVVRATTISFTSPATISDSGSGFGAFRVNDTIEVTGGTNRRRWTVATAAAGSLTVRPARITTASAGATITVRKAG